MHPALVLLNNTSPVGLKTKKAKKKNNKAKEKKTQGRTA